MQSSRFLTTVTLALVSQAFLGAQTATTGSVEGAILGANGAPVRGATVTLASSQIRRVAVTDDQGRFHLGLLNPGAWKLTVEKAGYQAATQSVTVAANNTSPITLKVAEVATATVEVAAAGTQAAVIDPTTTAVGLGLSSDVFDKLPIGRNMNDLAFLAPTTSFGGTMTEGQGLDYAISGASGAENQFIVDGLVTNDPRYGGQGTELVTDFIESVQVETGGFKPEYSALGGVFNAVVKSGSNDLRAGAWSTYSPDGLQAAAKSNAAGFRQGAPARRWDVGFDAGGALVKDKLFYYVGLDLNVQTRTPYPNNSGYQSPDQRIRTTQALAKLNWFLSPEQQLTGSYIETRRRTETPGAQPAGYGDANFGASASFDTRNLSLIYDWTITPSLLLSVKAGSSRLESDTHPDDTTRPLIIDSYWYAGGGGGMDPDRAGLDYFRGGFGAYNREKGTSNQFKADLSWFVGNHTLKAGVSSLTSTYFREDKASGPVGENLTWNITGDGQVIYSILFGNIGGAEVKAKYRGLYLQDTWQVAGGLRLFYGARAETQEQLDAKGHAFLKFNDLGKYIQPRLGFTWDLRNDGRTKLSGSYAWYYEQVPQRMAIREFASQKYLLSFYLLDSYSSTGIGTVGAPLGTADYGGFFDSPPVANNLKLPKREEVTLGFEQSLPKGLVATVNATYRKLTDPIEDSTLVDADGAGYMNLPGGPLGLIWNPGRSVSWVAKTGTTDKDGNDISGQTITVGNTFFPEAYNKYFAVTLGLKHQSERTVWNASYTWSHLYGNYEGVIAPNYGGGGQPDGNITASWDFWPYVGTGDLGQDRRHTVKVFGNHTFSFGSVQMNVGGKWTWQSGLPISLIDDGSSTLGQAPGSLGAGNPLDPGGYGNSTFDHGLTGNHGRTPSVSVADLHVDLVFKAGRARLVPSLDIFNVFNSRTATSVWQYATKAFTGEPDTQRYGQAQEWLAGRRFQAGVKVQF